MQFFGYLRRNPNDAPDSDYTGYDFWLTKLNQFNGNFVNAEMVKSFLVSGEYRQRFDNGFIDTRASITEADIISGTIKITSPSQPSS